MSLGERARRLLEGSAGPFAAFSPDGTLLFATPQASEQLGGVSLAAAGAAGLATDALAQGEASGEISAATLTLQRMGGGNAAVLLATLAPLPAPAIGPEPPPVAAEAPSAPTMPDDSLVAETLETERPIEPAGEVAAIAETLAPPPPEDSQDEQATLAPVEAPEPAPMAEPDPALAEAPEPTVASAPIATPEPDPAPAAEPDPAPVPAAAHAPAQPGPKPRAIPERRHPLRFVWEIDADGRFTVTSPDFIEVMGDGVAARLGRSWPEVARALDLDPEGQLAPVLASRDTFSGIALAWPVAGMAERLPVELSGLPVFDRERAFRGYRGFGVCRELSQLDAIVAARRTPPASVEDVPAGPDEITPTEQAADPSVEAAKADAATADSQPAETKVAAPPAPEAEAPVATVPAADPQRPQLTVVPAAKNVVPFRAAVPAAPDKRPVLTPVERNAFQEIARALGARLEGTASEDETAAKDDAVEAPAEAAPEPTADEPTEEAAKPKPSHRIAPRAIPSAYAAGHGAISGSPAGGNGERTVLDRLPVGVLIYRGDELLHANRALLEWTGYEDAKAIAEAGGLERLFAEPGLALLGEPGGSGRKLAITTRRGAAVPVECRLFSIAWHGATALLIVLVRGEAEERMRTVEEALRQTGERVAAAEAVLAAAEERLRTAELAMRKAEAARRELESILETATDGVIVVDRDGMITSSNRSAEALFGQESHEITNRSFLDLFAPESHRAVQDYLNGLMRNGVASMLNDGREVIGRVGRGGLIPLFMTIGAVADGLFCIVFRDITQWKRAEEDLTNAKREAERASTAKSEFLAKVSHEIRTPLNAIIGFAEVMMEEHSGPIANERYRQYLKDIRTSGEHVISLVNDLLDLSKIEAGALDLNFVSVRLNEVVQQCVAIMQPQANRERIIIRTSLLPTLPPVVADERSIRQIVLNLLSNSIKFTGAGGQVIVSTALSDQGEAFLRVRDTGIGMSEKEVATALEPFRQVATSGRAGAGTGLGLPLTKALAEANRASFTIKSAAEAGTLVEIAFPATRVLAE